MRLSRLILTFLLVLRSSTFELQDTIHKLIEENIHLHDQLENLTKALRDLKWMLIHRSEVAGHHEDVLTDRNLEQLWDEWSEHGINAETHLLLEQALCGQEWHVSAAPVIKVAHLFLWLSIILLLTDCFSQL